MIHTFKANNVYYMDGKFHLGALTMINMDQVISFEVYNTGNAGFSNALAGKTIYCIQTLRTSGHGSFIVVSNYLDLLMNTEEQ